MTGSEGFIFGEGCGVVGRRFVDQRRRDPYYRAAQREGLRSRAAFKLGHLANKYPIFHHGDAVLDLGAAPGGWSLVARGALGRTGRVVAVDPRPIEPADGVETVRGRVGDPRLLGRLGGLPFDVMLSDMSPRVSGAYATDHARSVGLVELAVELARTALRPGGVFVAKVFAGDLLDDLVHRLRPEFERVVLTKPPASREGSSEMYVVGFGFRPRATAAPPIDPPEGPFEAVVESSVPRTGTVVGLRRRLPRDI